MIAAFSRKLLERQVAVVVVGFPATPLFLGRARICISAAHCREDLDYALDQIQDVTRACLLQFNAGGPRAREAAAELGLLTS